MTDFNEKIIEEFRANAGKVGGPFEGSPLALLTTVGARSGRRRTSPVGYVPDGDRVLVVASNAGAPHHPAWYHNLLANPQVTVEIGTESHEATAVPAQGEERDRLFARVVRAAPGYGDYQAMTSRILPVVVLHRTHPASAAAWGRALGEELRELHGWFRQELATLRDDVEAYLGDQATAPGAGRATPQVARQLRERCLSFCEGLGRHHTGEDTVAFPHLKERFPELDQALDRLRREHAVVERLRGELQAALGTLDTGGAGQQGPDRLRADVERLASELEAHFDYEEEQLIPALNSLTGVPWPRPR
ncbi:nitroreductase/quinone reductase family protein [Actinomadura sp. HBU206391]|uniref:nitroreductase/quinone reductase family protein n=1 Tax=Actinomadura sp. HBU206391 TaxID=2731692 RepID=UPI0021C6CFA1|nr:nitroreductase/quinone reductase family protein [Actinomadura sp. HBU206391]